MKKQDYVPFFLLCSFVLVWLFLSINPTYRIVWISENILSVIFVFFLVATYRYLRLSTTSYILLFGFLLLHSIGAYYSYTEMPLFSLLKGLFGLGRNHYDRFVHFLFGVVFFVPIQEFCQKKLRLSVGWSSFFSFMMILALKGAYEVIEYGWLIFTDNELIGMAYLGMQGDVWDAQKDIFWGMIGAIISWVVVCLQKRKR
ncbi:DUF2238 domain-containing protein [Candidatus Woesearchaeota archaeon]|nr:DUF2238 domain-containing protein [Candidatus Woesearchaeota archaeon]